MLLVTMVEFTRHVVRYFASLRAVPSCKQVIQFLVEASSDSCETVELPRVITVRNIRLGLALRIFQLGALCVISWFLVLTKGWVKIVEPQGMGVLNAWDETSSSRYIEQMREDQNGLCQELSTFDYAYSASWLYSNYSCVTASQKSERFQKQGLQMVYLPTAYQETVYTVVPMDDGAEDCSNITEPCSGPAGWVPDGYSCQCSVGGHYLVTGAAALSMAFEHGYSLVHHSQIVDTKSSAQRSDVTCSDTRSTCDIQGEDGRELRTITVVKGTDGE